MKSNLKKLIALVGVAILAVSSLHAQESKALVEALVKKGVITDQEAEEIRADLVKEFSTTSAGKLEVGSHIKKLKLYGDARWRYEYVGQDGQVNGSNNSHNWQARYRLRLGAEYAFKDNFSGGFELGTSTANDSGNQTIGAGFGKFAIDVNLLYLTYKPWDWVTVTGGKIRNPFYTTDMLWSTDLNPEGAAEVFTWNATDLLTVGLTTAQFNYTENSDSGSLSASGNDKLQDSWIYAVQAPVTYKFGKWESVTVAPAFYKFTGNSGAPIVTSSPGFTSTLSATNLNLIAAPGDVSFKAFDQKFKVYWDFVYNTSGEARIHQTYGIGGQNNDISDSVAWLAGLQIGDSKKKGDWLVSADFRQIGLGAVDSNLNDSSWGNGYINQQGVKLRGSYNFTDFLTGGVTYYNTWNYKENIATGTNQTPSTAGGVNGVNATSRLQLDVVWKF